MSYSELLIVKFLVSTIIVLVLSFTAEYVSPKWAGVLSGFPTGSAITLHFYALENGLKFAGESAIYNMVGLVAMQMFIFCYYRSGLVVRHYKIIYSIIGGVLGYAGAVAILSQIAFNPSFAVVIPIISIISFKYAFAKINSSTITEKKKPTLRMILGRAGLSAATICAITGLAKFVGSSWAGLFSAFPTTLFPLIIIIHFSYGEQHAHSIIKHVPDGLGSLLIYSLILYLCYPEFSLYLGILTAFAGALLYLAIYRIITVYISNSRSNRLA